MSFTINTWLRYVDDVLIDQHSRNSSEGRLIDPKTGNEIKKSIFISAPYFPGLSESFKQLFKYTPVQICFKGENTIKSMLMHPKDKVDPSLKKDVVYQWSCTKPNCKSSYIRETSRSLCDHVKEHSKEGSNSAIYQHCSTKGHPLPNIDQFKVIDQEKSQITQKWQYTFESWTLNSTEMLAKWLLPVYLILSWV